MANMNTLTASIVELQNQNRVLRESLGNVLALARIKWGNLDPDANKVFTEAEALLQPSVTRLPAGEAHGLKPETVGDLIYRQHRFAGSSDTDL